MKEYESVENIRDYNTPKEKLNVLIYIIMLLFGISCLIPTSCLFSTFDYFINRFPKYDPTFVFPLTLTGPMFSFMFIGLFLEKYIGLLPRILVGCAGIFVCTIAIPLLAQFLTQDTAWIVINATIVIMGISGSLLQNGVFGLVGMLPARYVAGTMVGIGFSGVAFNIVRVFLILGLPPDDRKGRDDNNLYVGSLIFFGTAAFVCLVCALSAIYVFKSTFARYYIQKSGNYSAMESTEIEPLNKTPSNSQNSSPTLMSEMNRPKTVVDAYKILGFQCFQMTLCMLNTFVVYPGVAQSTTLKFLANNKSETTWFVMIITSTFSIFDTVGRYIAEHVHVFNHKSIVLVTIFRLLFIPSFLLIAKLDSPNWLLGADYFKILHVVLFGTLNGFHCTRLMVIGPEMVSNDLKEKAGMIMNIHLVGGIFAGSLISTFGMSRLFD